MATSLLCFKLVPKHTFISTLEFSLSSKEFNTLLPLTPYSAFSQAILSLLIKYVVLAENFIQRQTYSSPFLSFRLITFIFPPNYWKENTSLIFLNKGFVNIWLNLYKVSLLLLKYFWNNFPFSVVKQLYSY